MVTLQTRRPAIAPARTPAVRRALRAKQQRGASVLIVFLVVTMLTGIGMFAARSATLSTGVAGSSKQLAQTRRVTEYAILNVVSRDLKGYIHQMPKFVPTPNDPKCLASGQVPNATCYSFSMERLQEAAGIPLIQPADPLNGVPGGLGAHTIAAEFNIDMSDLAPAAPPVFGEMLNGRTPTDLKYWQVTFTATGHIRPISTPATLLKNLASSASVQTWRAHVVVGPLDSPPARSFTP